VYDVQRFVGGGKIRVVGNYLPLFSGLNPPRGRIRCPRQFDVLVYQKIDQPQADAAKCLIETASLAAKRGNKLAMGLKTADQP
jgi:hypothetical protein